MLLQSFDWGCFNSLALVSLHKCCCSDGGGQESMQRRRQTGTFQGHSCERLLRAEMWKPIVLCLTTAKKHIGSTYVSASIMCMTKLEIVYGYTEYFVFPRCTVLKCSFLRQCLETECVSEPWERCLQTNMTLLSGKWNFRGVACLVTLCLQLVCIHELTKRAPDRHMKEHVLESPCIISKCGARQDHMLLTSIDPTAWKKQPSGQQHHLIQGQTPFKTELKTAWNIF